jgi:peptidoglycan/LPS O-acetylase OafA/YrhL
MTIGKLDPQGRGRPPWTPIRSGWPQWVGYAAAAWSLVYGLLGLYWTLGGGGFPFGVENDPYAAKVSVLEHLRQDTAAPAIAVLGLGAALVALAMAHGRAQGLPGAVLLGFAWTMAVALAVVLPDVRR